MLLWEAHERGEKRKLVAVWLFTQWIRAYVMYAIERDVGRSTVPSTIEIEKKKMGKTNFQLRKSSTRQQDF